MLLSGAPRAIIDFLRAGRTAALMARGAVGRRPEAGGTGYPSPPLWLRRHTGPVTEIESSADSALALLEELGLLRPDSRVVDAGCGFGVMAIRLRTRLGTGGRYLGLDLHGPSVRWAQRHLSATDPRLRFERVGPGEAWPMGGAGDADVVLAKSFFTHLTEGACRVALREIARALAPSGRAVVTAFLFEAERPPADLFPYPGPDALVRWRLKNRPESAVAYERGRFTRLLTSEGLSVAAFRPAFWPRAERLDAQDVLVLEKRLLGTSPPGADELDQ